MIGDDPIDLIKQLEDIDRRLLGGRLAALAETVNCPRSPSYGGPGAAAKTAQPPHEKNTAGSGAGAVLSGGVAGNISGSSTERRRRRDPNSSAPRGRRRPPWKEGGVAGKGTGVEKGPERRSNELIPSTPRRKSGAPSEAHLRTQLRLEQHKQARQRGDAEDKTVRA